MRKQIVYLTSHTPHLPYLVVSLRSLRRYWNGEVIVHAWPESIELVQLIAQDKRLGITAVKREPDYRGKNDQFLNKILLMRSLNADFGIYLDADTLVNGPLDLIWNAIEHDTAFAATQFNEWTVSGGVVRNRIKRLLDIPEIPSSLIHKLLSDEYRDSPSVNGGVFGCRPSSAVLNQWYQWSWAARKIFIADETVLHILQAWFPPESFGIIRSTYNCSPRHKPTDVKDEEVKIWHFHGDSNVRPNKSMKGVELWYPEFLDCCKYNIGNINIWVNGCGNKYLPSLIEFMQSRS